MLKRLRNPWPDHRAERLLGAVACSVGLVIALMILFVAVRAWPTFAHNGLSWLGFGGDVDKQVGKMIYTGPKPPAAAYHLRAWPLVYGTLLSTGFAVLFGLVFALLSAIFIVEFAPGPVQRVITPVVRLLASVPSVIYGLVGILVLAPFVGNHVISGSEKQSVEYVVQLDGTGLVVAVVILTLMVTPIMIALIADALRSVPTAWREGAVALGVNPLRATLAVSLRAIRPAIVAAAVLACARALGEAVMLSMVSGSRAFTPKPIDGVVFLFEPLRTLAASIVENAEALNAPAVRSTVYAFALLLLFSAFALSLSAYLVKLPLRRYHAGAR
ncbi:MAG TPA: ABC transporter permease subunit [Solirubrobacteraceae bacterium]|nr:ABC transporter permease subunit [Solirubrobacteraceae bacterium]